MKTEQQVKEEIERSIRLFFFGVGLIVGIVLSIIVYLIVIK
jgi:hypothetical protein